MVIQKLLFPHADTCTDWEMFFRSSDSSCYNGKEIILNPDDTLSLSSYFNSFSIGKWLRFTRLDNLKLELEIQGQVEFKAYHSIGYTDIDVFTTIPDNEKYNYIHENTTSLDINVTQTDSRYIIEFTTLPEEGIIYIDIIARDSAKLLSGAYTTEARDLNPIDLALGICTFRREKEIAHNIELIQRNIIDNPNSPLYNHVEIYISDNGHTLDKKDFPSDHIHLFENKNLGGAGGFTRTMIESVFRNTSKPHSHLILMDDDIQVSTDTLERTYSILQLIKEEFKDAFLGAAMLELVERYKQFENGASFTGIDLISYNHGWDLRRKECVAANEIDLPINYTGWWYCCIPTSVIRPDNLPLPQFIHYDDIEYGVRNSAPGVILMNGLCVWHPYGDNKQPVSMNYYDMRNVMIAMSGSDAPCTPIKAAIRFMGTVITETLRYRYSSAETFYRGIEDYYRGPEYFMELDAMQNHQDLMAINDKYEDPVGIDLSKVENRGLDQRPPHCAVIGTFCWFLPALKKERYIGIHDTGVPFFTKNLYFYDENRGKGFWLRKSYPQAFKNAGRCIKDTCMILTKHNKMMKRWKDAKPIYTSLEYWEKYLDI